MKLFIIIFLFFIIQFAYGQESIIHNSTQNNTNYLSNQINYTDYVLSNLNTDLDETNSILRELKTSIEETSYANSIIDSQQSTNEILATFIASLFGVAIALNASKIRDWTIEKNQKKKIKILLKDDFQRIYDNINVRLLDIHQIRSKIKFTNNLENEILSSKGIIDFILVKKLLTNIRLLHWDVIAQSGYMIKLSTNEIRIIQAQKNYLDENHRLLLEYYNNASNRIIDVVRSNESDDNIKKIIRFELNGIILFYHFTYSKIYENVVDTAKKITWLDIYH